MVDDTAMHLAARNRALTLSVCSTGSIMLASTSAGYTRTTGSFLDDGFAEGMECAVAGFPLDNGAKVITGVSALTIEVSGGCFAQSAAGSRSLSVGLPSMRAWENSDFVPVAGVPYVVEQYVPGPAPKQITLGPLGELEVRPMYQLQVWSPSDTGILADGAYAKALVALFPPRQAIPLSNGDVLRVRAGAGAYRGQRLPGAPGFSVIPVTVPFELRTPNSI